VELSQVIERISARELAGVDETHEDVAEVGAIWGLIEQRVFAMQDCFFQGTFAEVVVQRCSSFPQKQCEAIATVGHVGNRRAQAGVRLDAVLLKLFGEPSFQLIHQRPTVDLMKADAFFRRHLLFVCYRIIRTRGRERLRRNGILRESSA